VIPFTIHLIQVVQRLVIEGRRGEYKKQVVLTVLRLIIERDSSMPEDDKAALFLALDTTIPSTIDVAVGIATGRIDLEKEAGKAARIWRACFPCCF